MSLIDDISIADARIQAQKEAYISKVAKCKNCKVQIIYSDTGLKQLSIDWCKIHEPKP